MFEHLKVWTNGKRISWNEAVVPMLSHGFSRGSAIFEVFGVYAFDEGVYAFRMDKHLDRLFRSAELLGMEIGVSRGEIEAGCAQMVKENGVRRGLLKIMGYWGEEAVIHLVLNSKLDVSIFAIPRIESLALDSVEPISICFSRWRKIRSDMIPSEAKACANYLNGYLARKDAADRGYNLGVLLTDTGDVAEGSIESVFMVKNGVLKTPPMGNILAGVSRRSILRAAEIYKIPVSEERITQAELMDADEIFTAHTGIRVLPVKRIENRELSPVPGPVTTEAMRMMEAVTGKKDDRFSDWFQKLA